MLAISVEFLHGTFRGTGADDASLAGEPSLEWPPSPARLHSAFVSADGTRGRCRVTDGTTGLDLLDGEPEILAEVDPLVNPIWDRYVPVDETKASSHLDYPARSGVAVRPGARAALQVPVVTYVWSDAEPTSDELESLRRRAARIPYLGCADSPVRVRVSSDPPTTERDRSDARRAWIPDRSGTVAVSVAFPGRLEALDDHYDAWAGGESRRRSWLPNRFARYRHPLAPPPGDDDPRCVWLRFGRGVRGRQLVHVANCLRKAVLERSSQIAGGPNGVPAVLHGHATEPGSEHVRWLPLPNAGFPHSDGRVHGACIWLPPRTSNEVTELVTAAVDAIDELVEPRRFRVPVSLFDGTRTPWSSNPHRWTQPSTSWTSVTPVLHERHTRGGPDLEEIGRWCRFAGLPQPIEASIAGVPWLHGSVQLHPSELGRFAGRRLPYSHVRLRFAEPIAGPVALGRGRHFGLGLFAPDPDEPVEVRT